jgi:hypothetical protein
VRIATHPATTSGAVSEDSFSARFSRRLAFVARPGWSGVSMRTTPRRVAAVGATRVTVAGWFFPLNVASSTRASRSRRHFLTPMTKRRSNPQGSRKRGYTDAQLQECVNMVIDKNMAQCAARDAMRAKGAVISKSTLHGYLKPRKTHGMVKPVLVVGAAKTGPPTILTPSQEQWLYNAVVEGAEKGFPFSKWRVKEAAHVLSEHDVILKKATNAFGPDGPSEKWWRCFKKRWKLSRLKTSDREPKRTTALNLNVVTDAFDKFGHELETGYGGKRYPLDRVYNMDEFGVQSRLGTQEAGIYITGWQDPRQRTGQGDRQSYTGIACNSAAGKQVPLTFIFKGLYRGTESQKEIAKIVQDKVGGSVFFKEDTHMINTEYFHGWLEWFQRQSGATPQKPVLLVLDGHTSRGNVTVWKHAMSLGITLFILPGAVTSHLQPQDVGVIGPFKRQLHKDYRTRCETLAGDALDHVAHVGMLLQAWEASVGSFTNTGLQGDGISKVVVDAWDKSGLVCQGTGKPDPMRLASAIKKAEPFRNEKVELTDKCRDLWRAAAAAPLPLCTPENDLRAPVEIPELPPDAPAIHDVLRRVAADVLAVGPRRANAELARLDEEDKKSKRKRSKGTAEEVERRNQNTFAKACNYTVRHRGIRGLVRWFHHAFSRGVHRACRTPIPSRKTFP